MQQHTAIESLPSDELASEMKKILFLSNCSTTQDAPEHLDAALACAVMGFDVGVTLSSKSLRLLEEAGPDHPASDKLQMLPAYGITDVFIEIAETKSDQLSTSAIDNKTPITQTELHQLIDKYDHVIRL